MADQTDLGPAPLEPDPSSRPRSSAGAHAAPAEKRPGSFWRELPVLLLIAFGVALLVKTFLVSVYYIPSGSMEQTLQVGDRIAVNKVVYHLRPIARGDVVVFDGADSFTPEVTITPPSDPVGKALDWIGRAVGFAPDERDFVKRVIGVGGDHVVCCDAQGQVTVNGTPLDETSYLYPGNSPSDDRFDIIVPAGRLFVMGDHRAASSDSRAHLGDPGGGFVDVDKVIGRAFAVLVPFSHAQLLQIPDTFSDVKNGGS